MKDIDLRARFRVTGKPELWDPFTGDVRAVDHFENDGDYIKIEQRIDGNTATFVVFHPDRVNSKSAPSSAHGNESIPLAKDWEFSVSAHAGQSMGRIPLAPLGHADRT